MIDFCHLYLYAVKPYIQLNIKGSICPWLSHYISCPLHRHTIYMGCTGVFITLHFTHYFSYDSTGLQPFWQVKINSLINLVIKTIKVLFLISILLSDSKLFCTDSNYPWYWYAYILWILVGIQYITMCAPKWQNGWNYNKWWYWLM